MPTSSQFHRIVTPKGKPAKQARGYMFELIAERLLGEPMTRNIDHIPWVRDGKEREFEAARQLGLYWLVLNESPIGTRV